jgi:hypothetical protein
MKTPIRHYFALARRLARVLAPPLLVSMVLLVAQPVLRAQTTVPFEYFNFEGGLAVGPYTGSGAVVEIPESIEGQPVTRILPNAFRASQVTHVLVPSSVKFIENGGLRRLSRPGERILGKRRSRDWGTRFRRQPEVGGDFRGAVQSVLQGGGRSPAQLVRNDPAPAPSREAGRLCRPGRCGRDRR